MPHEMTFPAIGMMLLIFQHSCGVISAKLRPYQPYCFVVLRFDNDWRTQFTDIIVGSMTVILISLPWVCWHIKVID